MVSDPNWANVKLLLHCDSLIDEVSGAAVSTAGTAAVSTAQKVFGSGSIAIPGSGDYVTRPNSADWDFGTGTFTIELRVRFASSPTTGQMTLITHWPSGWHFGFTTTGPYFRSGAITDSTAYAWSPTLNQWYAMAVERDGSNVLRIYIDGTMVSKTTSYTDNLTGGSNPLTVGSLEPSFSSFDLNGYVDEVRITKGTARYASDSGYTVSTTPFSPISDITSTGIGVAQTSTPNILAGVTLTDGAGVQSQAYSGAQYIVTLSSEMAVAIVQEVARGAALSDGIATALTQVLGQPVLATDRFRSQDFITPLKRLPATATAGVGVAETLKRDIGLILQDRIGVAELLGPAFKYQSWASDLIRTASTLAVGRPVSLTSGIGVAALSLAVVGAYVLERLGLRDTLLPTTKYGQVATDRVRINDALRRFLGGAFADTLGMHDALTPYFQIGRALTETLGVHDALSPKLLLRITAADSIQISAATALKMVFKPTLVEHVEISAAHVSPNGTITTWVVNTRTGAVTEYGNYDFNSFAQRGHKYLGASSTGLYELDGDDDQGVDIIAKIKSGWAQFAGSRYSMFKAAYLGMRADGDVFFKIEAGTGETYTYQVVVQDMQTTKIRMGKGLRARYFSFELTTTGQDFDIDSIEFVPIVAQRRV